MTVARRYARALYEEAERRSKTDVVDDDMKLIRTTLEDSRELAGLFRSPVVSREKKENVVRSLFGGRVDALTLRFLELLVEKQREDIFPELAQAYRDMRDRQMNVVEATARVAGAISDDHRADLVSAVEKMTGKRVRLNVERDDDLLGGVIIRVGDTVYDGSVRHHLEMLREQMEAGSHRLN